MFGIPTVNKIRCLKGQSKSNKNKYLNVNKSLKEDMSQMKFMFLRSEEPSGRKGDFTQQTLPPNFNAVGDRIIHKPMYMKVKIPVKVTDPIQKPNVKKFSSRNKKKRT